MKLSVLALALTLAVASVGAADPSSPEISGVIQEPVEIVPQESVFAADDSEAVSDENEFEEHIYPVLLIFETEEDFSETPDIFQEIESAFILSGNEAHGDDNVVFEKAVIDEVYHDLIEAEDVGLEPTDADASGTDGEVLMSAEYDGESPGEEHEEEAEGSLETETDDKDAPTLGFKRIRRRRKERKARKNPTTTTTTPQPRRVRTTTARPYIFVDTARDEIAGTFSIRCRFCRRSGYRLMGEKSDALTLRMHRRWERLFCRRLRQTKFLKTASRCFIRVDRANPLDGKNTELGQTVIDQPLIEA